MHRNLNRLVYILMVLLLFVLARNCVQRQRFPSQVFREQWHKKINGCRWCCRRDFHDFHCFVFDRNSLNIASVDWKCCWILAEYLNSYDANKLVTFALTFSFVSGLLLGLCSSCGIRKSFSKICYLLMTKTIKINEGKVFQTIICWFFRTVFFFCVGVFLGCETFNIF